jgi:hypothetical protein
MWMDEKLKKKAKTKYSLLKLKINCKKNSACTWIVILFLIYALYTLLAAVDGFVCIK